MGAASGLGSALLGSVGPLTAPFFLAYGLTRGAHIGTEAASALAMHVAKIAGDGYVIRGLIPAARLRELEQAVPGLTHGEGLLESAFDRYRPVAGRYPERARWDDNPLDRTEYLLRVERRVPLAEPGRG